MTPAPTHLLTVCTLCQRVPVFVRVLGRQMLPDGNERVEVDPDTALCDRCHETVFWNPEYVGGDVPFLGFDG